MGAQDLTTIDNVRGWCGDGDSANDPLFRRLITQATRFICNETIPSFLPTAVSEVRDGTGGDRLRPQRYPVLSLTSLAIAGDLVTVAPAFVAGEIAGSGYVLDAWDGTVPGNAQFLSLRGNDWAFGFGRGTIAIGYVAGYQVAAEPATVPATGALTVTPLMPLGRWGSDGGVTYANGTALAKVASGPALGQYTVDAGTGVYGFAAADAGVAVLVTYGFVPADIEQACIELVAERFKYKDRIGILSKALGGQETISFSLRAMPDYVRETLTAYHTPVFA